MNSPFVANPQITEWVDALISLADTKEVGEYVNWWEIEHITGLVRELDEKRLRYLIGKWKRHYLLMRRIAILSEPNVGYKILAPGEQVRECPRRRNKRAAGEFKRGKLEVELVNTPALTMPEKRLRAVMIQQLAKAEKLVNNNLIVIHRTESSPLWPCPDKNSDTPAPEKETAVRDAVPLWPRQFIEDAAHGNSGQREAA